VRVHLRLHSQAVPSGEASGRRGSRAGIKGAERHEAIKAGAPTASGDARHESRALMTKYDWHAADVALRDAVRELMQAQRHRNHRKRVNVLNDLLAVECAIRKARKALLGHENADDQA
jgi:hypothetical protein